MIDPDDYDFISSGSYSSSTHTSPAYRAEKAKPKVYIDSKGYVHPVNERSANESYSGNKWNILEFIIVMTIIGIIGYAIAAFAGELFGAIVIIIIGVIVMKYL